jgi:hypothetical protein
MPVPLSFRYGLNFRNSRITTATIYKNHLTLSFGTWNRTNISLRERLLFVRVGSVNILCLCSFVFPSPAGKFMNNILGVLHGRKRRREG